MKRSLSGRAAVLASAVLVASTVLAATAPSVRSGAATPRVRPVFAVLHHGVPFGDAVDTLGAATVPTWTFSFSYGGSTYRETFLGSSPTAGATTTVPVVVVPVQLTYGSVVMSPERVLADGETTVQNTLASPLFKDLTYTQGGTDVGTTQYGDAYQRASLWGTVHAHPGYHLLLSAPTVEPLQSLTVPARYGAVVHAFGGTELTAGINWFDGKVVPLIDSLKIPPDAITVFLTAQTYLTQGGTGLVGCCIGGYHSAVGTRVYAEAGYITTPGAFGQDVSALSHEVGEAIDDPFTTNRTIPPRCGPGAFEVGDPLEGDLRYGDYPYALGPTTFHLQDLVTPVYFGAPAATSLHGWTTFQGTHLSVCQHGP